MSKVVLDMSMSLDGFIAGLDDADGGLHNWYFTPSAKDSEVIDELIKSTGAMVIGRRSYDMGDKYDGYVDNPYQATHFVLTHQAPQRTAKGNTTFNFVSDGVESAISQARASAGTKDVVVGGGANIAQQLLRAGLLDEMNIHLIPILLGAGIRLFDNMGALPIELERITTIETSGVTHLKFSVLRQSSGE